MEPPPLRAPTIAIISPKRQRITSDRQAKVEDQQNCPYRIARPELNYNLASFGEGKNGVAQSGSVRNSLLLTSQEKPLNLHRPPKGLCQL